MVGFLKFIVVMYRISRLERKQARPMREIISATINGTSIPMSAQVRLNELDEKIRELRKKL